MKIKLNDLLLSLLITVVALIVLEIFSTTASQILGLNRFRLPFNILIILFLAFRVQSPFLAILIFVIQYFHSLFSLEGWAMGTCAGVIVYIVVSYLREVIHFRSAITTIIITQIFQLLWFVIVGSMIYLRSGELDLVVGKFGRFIPESIVISLLAPLAFSVLEQIWRVSDKQLGSEDY